VGNSAVNSKFYSLSERIKRLSFTIATQYYTVGAFLKFFNTQNTEIAL
jgi:hypothetical protein